MTEVSIELLVYLIRIENKAKQISLVFLSSKFSELVQRQIINQSEVSSEYIYIH